MQKWLYLVLKKTQNDIYSNQITAIGIYKYLRDDRSRTKYVNAVIIWLVSEHRFDLSTAVKTGETCHERDEG